MRSITICVGRLTLAAEPALAQLSWFYHCSTCDVKRVSSHTRPSPSLCSNERGLGTRLAACQFLLVPLAVDWTNVHQQQNTVQVGTQWISLGTTWSHHLDSKQVGIKGSQYTWLSYVICSTPYFLVQLCLISLIYIIFGLGSGPSQQLIGGLCQLIVTWLIWRHVTCNRNGSHPYHSTQVSNRSASSSVQKNSFFLPAVAHLVGISLDVCRFHARGNIVAWRSHWYCLIITITCTVFGEDILVCKHHIASM